MHRLKQRRSTGSYLAQEILPGVDLIDHVRIAVTDHIGHQIDRGAITIMQLPLRLLCMTGKDVQ